MANIEIPAILHSELTSYNKLLNCLWMQLLSFFNRQGASIVIHGPVQETRDAFQGRPSSLRTLAFDFSPWLQFHMN
jgi:hypothetical protein